VVRQGPRPRAHTQSFPTRRSSDLIDAPTVPAGFTVEVSTNGGASYTTVSGGGSVSLAIGFGASANINVRITEPAGQTVLTGYDRSEEHTSELQSRFDLVSRLLLEK